MWKQLFALLLVLVCLALVGCGDLLASDTNKIRLNLIAAKYQEGDLEVAIPEFQEYLVDYPRDDLAWTVLGHALKEDDQLDEAAAAYAKALEVNPENFQAISGQGILHRKRGEYDLAMAAYQRSVEIDPSYAQAYSSMSVIALKQLKDAEALEYAKKGYELDAEDPTIAANLAVNYHYNGDFENRARLTKIAIDLGYSRGEVLEKIYSGEMTVRDEN